MPPPPLNSNAQADILVAPSGRPQRPPADSPGFITQEAGTIRLSKIYTAWDNSFPYYVSEGKRMNGDFCIKMRLDNWCPRCHKKGHQDFHSKGVLTCRGQEAAPGSWPDGLFVRNVVGAAVGFPTLEATVISKMWQSKNAGH